MDHPLSHTSAVVGGVAFIFVAGCLSLLLADLTMVRSSSWGMVFVLSSAVLVASIIGYLRPASRAIHVPVFLAGVVMLSVSVWYLWLMYRYRADDMTERAWVLYQAIVMFGMWLAWAGRTISQLRAQRRGEG
jgi:Kef-type K+ transport system membrane component KefB